MAVIGARVPEQSAVLVDLARLLQPPVEHRGDPGCAVRIAGEQDERRIVAGLGAQVQGHRAVLLVGIETGFGRLRVSRLAV